MADCPEPIAECSVCGRAIHYGNACVRVSQQIGQIGEGALTVINEDELLMLCAECGSGLNGESVRRGLLGPLSSSLLPSDDSDDSEEPTASWLPYPPEVSEYEAYVREVLFRASVATGKGLQEDNEIPRITNAVIDYSSEQERSPVNQGLVVWRGNSPWTDFDAHEVGSCSRHGLPPLVIQETPYYTTVNQRDFSFVSLDVPTWSSDDEEASFSHRVRRLLMRIPDSRDHLYAWLHVFFDFCAGKEVAYLSHYKPSQRIRRMARRYHVRLRPLPIQIIPYALLQRHRVFRLLWLTEKEWRSVLEETLYVNRKEA